HGRRDHERLVRRPEQWQPGRGAAQRDRDQPGGCHPALLVAALQGLSGYTPCCVHDEFSLGPVSWAPMSVSVDPDRNLIYTADSFPGAIGALKLTARGLRTVWTAQQRTTEFLALIGSRGCRVVVDTDIPLGQCPNANTTDFVVWRDAQTGDELARTEQPLPAMTTGTMIQPYYFGKMFYMGLECDLLELAVQPAPARRH